MSWADLTPEYRDSPYMTLDMDDTGQRPVSVAAVQPTNEDTDISGLQNNTTQQHSASEKNEQGRLHCARQKLRAVLKGQTKLTFTWHTPNRINIK